jgi:hypothetical protein
MTLKVPNIGGKIIQNGIQDIDDVMDTLEKHPLSYVNWEAFPYKPEVTFAIGHADRFIFIKYYVIEKHIRAVNNEINGSVWEDSCVEFFVTFDDLGYYNFECNCIGTFLMGFGKERNSRQRLPNDVIAKIQSFTTLQTNPKTRLYNWTITWAIPTSVFIHHPTLSLTNRTCTANFYKCGDKTPEPHFITWNKVETEKPDYHRPEFFGKVVFE